MKKLICLVLVFTMMLTACSKWNVEIVDPTKPLESEAELIPSEQGETKDNTSNNNEEQKKEEPKPNEDLEESEQPEYEEIYEINVCGNKEAESFMYTNEAKKQIELFASNCAHIDFISSEDADSSVLWWFGNEIYSLVGENSLTENGNRFEFSKELGELYLLKYFGVDYEPKEDDFYFNHSTGNYWLGTAGSGAANEVLSYYFYMSNEHFVTVHVIYKEFGGKYGHSSMEMEVLNDGSEIFLRMLSSEKRDEFSAPTFEEQAAELSMQIVNNYQGKGLENENLVFSENDISRFIQRTVIYTNMNKRFRKAAPYIGIFPRDGEFRYHFSEEGIQRIAYEVFGIEDFEANMEGFDYDSEKHEYVSAMEWSFSEPYTLSDIEVEVNGNEYICSFILENNVYFEEEHIVYGEYRIIFELIDNRFLRYVGFEKV